MAVTLFAGYPQSEGAKIGSVAKVTGPSSYALGGFSISANTFGMQYFEHVEASMSVSGTYIAFFLPASAEVPKSTGKLVVIVTATGAQVAALTNLSAEKFVVRAQGI